MHRLIFEQIVPGALLDFDLPDLVSAVAPRTVWISDPMTPTNTPIANAEFDPVYTAAKKAFALSGAPGALHLGHPKPRDERAGSITGIS